MRFLLSIGISAVLLTASGAWRVLPAALDAPRQLVELLERAR